MTTEPMTEESLNHARYVLNRAWREFYRTDGEHDYREVSMTLPVLRVLMRLVEQEIAREREPIRGFVQHPRP